MKSNSDSNKILILLTTILLTSVLAYGQGPGFEDDVEDVPIDGGVTLVAAAAAAYGAKKLKDRKKAEK